MKAINEDIKKLVLWRLESMPKQFSLSIGSKGTFTRDELKEHVEEEDEVGHFVVETQLNYIKALSSGKISAFLAAK